MYARVFLGCLLACVYMLKVQMSPRPCTVHLRQPVLKVNYRAFERKRLRLVGVERAALRVPELSEVF